MPATAYILIFVSRRSGYALQELHDDPKIVLPSGKFNLPKLKRNLAEFARARGLKP